MHKDLLLITPPFTQLNTPYPATAYIKGFLNTIDVSCFQMDLGIEAILQLFSKEQLTSVFELAYENETVQTANTARMYALKELYINRIDTVISFLQGKQDTLARQLCTDCFLPRASRFDHLDDLEWAFGNMGLQDRAKHLATLFLEDISDFIVACVDENFGFSRYAERLGRSANSFDELYNALQQPLTFVDEITLDILHKRIETVQPKMVLLSIPFPGNLYSALRCGQFIKNKFPDIKVSMGGGFPNTELRSLKDPRVFAFTDFITLDDGERPIELLCNYVLKTPQQALTETAFKRTYYLDKSQVFYNNNSTLPDYKQSQVGTPDYSDLLLDQYIHVIEIANPMHSLWSDGRWNKLTMAHGCYWGKCTFCDISLDYIKLYEPVAANMLVDRMEIMIAQTGERGFHFVDEAAPPALMRAVALEILKRELTVTWWTNIRFEKSFTQDLCYLLKASGCIAVSGGLEVASDRLLKLIDKGVTVKQVAQVTSYFTQAGIMVHAYLMYGYPTQTAQETIDSLEMVRQLFELGIVQSGFWHRFALTAHSPVGMDPDAYGVIPDYKDIQFANNDLEFTDKTGIDHSLYSDGLKKSLFNYMHGIGFENDLQEWFDTAIPATTIAPDFIENCLHEQHFETVKPTAKLLWIGHTPLLRHKSKTIKGKKTTFLELTFHDATSQEIILLEENKANWLLDQLELMTPKHKILQYATFKKSYEAVLGPFELFWFAPEMAVILDFGLLVL